MEKEKDEVKNLAHFAYANVRILVDFNDYHIEKDTRLLIPFSYYEHYGLMNRAGEVVVEPKFDRIGDSCRNENDVVRVGLYYSYGFNRMTSNPSTYISTKWGLVDSRGNFILEPEYRGIGVSSDKKILTIQHMDYQYEVIKVDGEVIVPKGTYQWVDSFDKGLTRVVKHINDEKKWGIIDDFGNEVLPTIYSGIWNFFKKNRQWITIEAIDEAGNNRVGEFNLITHELKI